VNEIDRKARALEYKETPRPAGLYVVRNTKTGTSLFGSTPDLPGMLNRQKFQLEMGSHPDRELQADWDELGPDAFEFQVLDQLDLQGDANTDRTADLQVLKALWLEKFTNSGVPLYKRSLRAP